MSAYRSPDVVVAIACQRQHETQVQANRWQLAKLIESGEGGKAGRRRIDMKSALLTRAGAVLLTPPRQTSRRPELVSPGRLAPRFQA